MNKTFEYSIDDRMKLFSDGTISATYFYDPMGRRISKTVDGVTTKFLWEGNLLLGEVDSSNQITRIYLTNPDTYEPLAFSDWPFTSDKCYYQLTDHLMTPTLTTDTDTDVVWSVDMKAFGEAVVNEDPDGDGTPVANNIRFPGQYWDEESGLHYNWNRYYSPNHGRYVRMDPKYISDIFIIETILVNMDRGLNYYYFLYMDNILSRLSFLRNPSLLNQYLYSLNEPVFLSDYYGNDPLSVVYTVAFLGTVIYKAVGLLSTHFENKFICDAANEVEEQRKFIEEQAKCQNDLSKSVEVMDIAEDLRREAEFPLKAACAAGKGIEALKATGLAVNVLSKSPLY